MSLVIYTEQVNKSVFIAFALYGTSDMSEALIKPVPETV